MIATFQSRTQITMYAFSGNHSRSQLLIFPPLLKTNISNEQSQRTCRRPRQGESLLESPQDNEAPEKLLVKHMVGNSSYYSIVLWDVPDHRCVFPKLLATRHW